MSLILDALRKMEQERRSRRGSAQDLRPEVLRYRLAAQPKERSRYPLVVAGVALVCAGVGAGFFLKGDRGELSSQAAPEAAVSAPAAPQEPVAAPATAPAPAEAAAGLFPGPAAPAAEEEADEASAPRPAVPVAPAPVAPVAAAPRPVAPVEVAEHAAPPSEIAISGIAYQDDRRLRRAVLNGMLVGEGAEVAGARVVEIRETKVRLSRGGRIFEIPFSSGLHSR